ncbi:MAG: hypothetical protein WD604_00705 [Balneolaceae bacterium]
MTLIIALAINIICFTHTNAHDIYTSELKVIQYDSVLHLELRMNAFELESLGGKQMIKNGVIDWDQFSEGKEEIITKLNEALILKLNNNPLFTDKTGLTVDDTHHLIFRAHYNLAEDQRGSLLRIESKLREFTSRSHVTKVSFKKSDHQENAQLEGNRNTVEFKLVRKDNNEKNKVPDSKAHRIQIHETWLIT